jgi:hypothetical protein
MEPSKQLDLRYIAGLFDGEGCISLHVNRSGVPERYAKPRDVIQVSITNTFREVLDILKTQFGYGCVHKTNNPKNPKHKQCYSWTMTANKAKTFLREIEPFLIIKGAKARMVLNVGV